MDRKQLLKTGAAVGTGAATKEQVQFMLTRLLRSLLTYNCRESSINLMRFTQSTVHGRTRRASQ